MSHINNTIQIKMYNTTIIYWLFISSLNNSNTVHAK